MVGPQQWQELLKTLDEPLAHQCDFTGTKQHGSPEDESVDQARSTFAAAVQKLLLTQADADQSAQASQRLVQPLFRSQTSQDSELDGEVQDKDPPREQHDEEHQPRGHG